MHRVDTSTAAANLPAAETPGTPGYFSKGDPQSGAVPTTPGQDWFNMIQEELISILVAFGVTPDATKADYGQIADALLANFANILGNASQKFCVADAVANNEAVNLGQMLAAAGGLKSIQVFTASGTWTKPAGIKTAVVWVVGGGGGSSGHSGAGGGCGGGGAGCSIKMIDVSAISSETVTIGAGGTAGADTGTAGGTGGTSSFGAHCSATGGGGGTIGSTSSLAAGGSGSGGDVNIQGAPGWLPWTGSSFGGHGGASFMGGAAAGCSSNEQAHAGGQYGGGAAGGFSSSLSQAGAVGGAGVVIVWEY